MLAMTAPSHNLHIELAKKLRFAFEISRPTPQIRSVHPWYSNRARCGSPTPPSTADRKSTAPAILEETRETDWRESDPVEPDPAAGTVLSVVRSKVKDYEPPQSSNRLSGTAPRAETLTFLRWRWFSRVLVHRAPYNANACQQSHGVSRPPRGVSALHAITPVKSERVALAPALHS